METIIQKTDELISDRQLKLVQITTGERILVAEGEKIPLLQGGKLIRKLLFEKCKIFLNSSELQNLISYLEICPLTDDTAYETAKRIYSGKDSWAYELDKDLGECVIITPTEFAIGELPHVIFRHSADYTSQVNPDWDTEIESFFSLIHTHFNLKNERQEKLLILYLVTAFFGLNINHPILVLVGEKGSSKSTTMRKLERLIDPKQSDLGGIPKGSDGLELRLSNNYFVTLDNLSFIRQNVSDTLARAVTGGTVTKRALYENTKEVILDIKAMVAMNGVSLVAKESDLLDRSLILELRRISASEIKTEEELWRKFENDRPKILGCIFQILSVVLFDREEPVIPNKIRLADFHTACVKVGEVLGMSESEVSDLLWENQSNVNRKSIDEDIVACCLVELMKRKSSYVNSVSGLLKDLGDIAFQNSIVSSTLPKTPNHLSNRLSKVRSNLQSEYGISYNIANVGTFKQITIEKNNTKSCESCERTKIKKKKQG